jgi:hypothetical protein
VNGAAERPRVGLFGAFDTGDLGEVALRRVIEMELARTRPDIELVAIAPFGVERPVPGDEGRPAAALPQLSSGAGLGLDALIIAGDVLAGERHWAARYGVAAGAIAERGVVPLALRGTRSGAPAAPEVIWFAVGPSNDPEVDVADLDGRDVWVRDVATQERLGGTAVQSGDPLLCASRVFGVDALRRRADLLRMCGAVPSGRRLVVEVTRALASTPSGQQLAEAVHQALRSDPTLSVVVMRLDPDAGTPETALQVAGLVAERVHHLPAWAGLDDIAAALSGAAAVIATSQVGAHLAAALGAPVATTAFDPRLAPEVPVLAADLTPGIESLLRTPSPADIREAVATLEGAFAELGERLPRAPGSKPVRDRRDPVESALAVLQQRLVDERSALQAELSRVQAELEHLQASPEHRIARPIREGYRRWQRRRT